ncbi:hydro-lyase, Fe-S type, tartrate/fumarate subfamily, beta subunit [Thermodesulfatator indicus DSM 15286]|uniref:Hydro-lyase, Fe-S type, tartrate/fumarate subfamily, beta subunit n=1 Tax=Thermodesulfatator indicus (strain DSM 15286 / JCM 11887 / CIR29812) TaxID=667014 RepID=F8ACQ8_THEID|nr:hydro-lyase, Fe-S type, tartrate/fumarate subfamily, beta subunit [Thermodesulfatator indicus DSM 15286]
MRTMEKKISFPLKDKRVLEELHAGDFVTINGTLLAARDQTHRKLLELLEKGKPLPVALAGQCIYYVGPTPAPPGKPIGSAGPTTSYRMDAYTPALLAQGVCATIGKGKRSREVREALLKHKAIYLATFGGAGAYLSKCIKEVRPLAFEELGPEALLELRVENFPAVVINDLHGRDFYEESQEEWAKILAGERS